MEVLLKVSKELERYIEYVPQEVLPMVLDNLLQNSIKSFVKPVKESASEHQTIDDKLDSILVALKELQSQGIVFNSAVNTEQDDEPSVNLNLTYEKVQFDEDSDMGDFLDLLK